MITKVKETFTETEDYMTEWNKLDSLAAVSISVPLSILFLVNKDIIKIYIGVIFMVFIVMGVIAMGILLWGYCYGGHCYGDIAMEYCYWAHCYGVLLWGFLPL